MNQKQSQHIHRKVEEVDAAIDVVFQSSDDVRTTLKKVGVPQQAALIALDAFYTKMSDAYDEHSRVRDCLGCQPRRRNDN